MPIAGVSKKREEGEKEGKGEGGGWNHTGESGETQEGRQGKTQEREEGEEEAQGIVFMIPFLTCIPALIFCVLPRSHSRNVSLLYKHVVIWYIHLNPTVV